MNEQVLGFHEKARENLRAQDERCRKYASVRGLKASSRACIHRVAGARCPRSILVDGPDSCWPPGTDHPVLWLKGGAPHSFESHPYQISDDTFSEMVAYAARRGLTFMVVGYSWYYPGNTLCIVWRKKGALLAT